MASFSLAEWLIRNKFNNSVTLLITVIFKIQGLVLAGWMEQHLTSEVTWQKVCLRAYSATN